MIRTWNAVDANSAWQQIAQEFSSMAEPCMQPSRCGPTFEILHACIAIDNPRERWIVSRCPSMNPAFAIAEVVSVMRGRNDASFLNYWNSKLPRYAGDCEHYSGAYGYRLASHFGYDQIKRATDALASNSTSRQVILQFWDPVSDMPQSNGASRATDVPCNTSSMMKIRDGKLEWLQVVRSNDLFRGVPYNIVQFTSLQEILSGWLGVEIGTYNHIADSLHVYASDFESVRRSRMTIAASNTDSLAVDFDKSSRILKEMEHRMDEITRGVPSEKIIEEYMDMDGFPQAYANLLLVLGAYAARKYKYKDLASDLIARCNNPVLVQVWKRWITRSQGV